MVEMTRIPVISMIYAILSVAAGRLLARAGALPAVVGLPLAVLPLAFATSLVVAAMAQSAAPLERGLALPALETRGTWDGEVGAFADRLSDGFGLDATSAQDFAAWILEASARQGLPADLIAGLVYTESSFRRSVRSYAGAVGPAQVKPVFWQRFCGDVDLADPEQNVYCGAQILAHYMQRCGSYDCALRLYNVGPGNMRKPYFERASHRYLAKVESHRARMADLGEL